MSPLGLCCNGAGHLVNAVPSVLKGVCWISSVTSSEISGAPFPSALSASPSTACLIVDNVSLTSEGVSCSECSFSLTCSGLFLCGGQTNPSVSVNHGVSKCCVFSPDWTGEDKKEHFAPGQNLQNHCPRGWSVSTSTISSQASK